MSRPDRRGVEQIARRMRSFPSDVFDLLLRDGPRCHWCRQHVPTRNRTVDHLIPLSRGGTTGLDNKVLACRSCNTAKADADPALIDLGAVSKPQTVRRRLRQAAVESRRAARDG